MSPLPLEIWSLVAGQVHAAGGTRDLLALCLVSRQVHDVAAAWLYRSLILDLNLSKKPLQLLAERMTSRTAYHVREFKASSGILCVFLGCHDSEFKMLRSVIQRLTALRRFKWDHFVSIPNLFVKDLNQMQSLMELDLSYHVSLGARRHGLSSCTALKGNMKLTKLALHITHRPNEERLEGNSRFHECKNLIIQAPALKSLTILIKESLTNSMDGSPYREPVTSFSFFPGEVLPPLETLVLINYAVGKGSPNDIENRLDLANLRTLKLRGALLGNLDVFLRTLLNTQQINLKHFSIQDSYRSDASSEERWHGTLDDFLESFVGLESLVLHGECVSKLPSLGAISKHGETLQCLKIHSSQTVQLLILNPDLGFTADKLQTICKSCPYLRELAIDFDRDEQFKGPLHLIQQSLRNFPSLRKLEIHTPLYRSNMFLISRPVDKLYVDDFAARVRSPRLENLTIKVGDEAKHFLFDQHLSEQLRWENRHSFAWHVKYYSQSPGFKVWESGRAERDVDLKSLAALVGISDSPPQDWEDYKTWMNELEDLVQKYLTDVLQKHDRTGECRHRLQQVIALSNLF